MSKKITGGVSKLLSNNTVLYLMSFLAFLDVYNHLKNNDTQSLFVFVISVYLTSMSTENVTVMIIIGLVVSNIYKSVTKEGFKNPPDLMPDSGLVQEHEQEAFENKSDDEDDEEDEEDEEDEANVEKESMTSNKNISKKQVKDAKELANIQGEMLNNLKAMTPLIKQVEGFADKYKSSLNNDKLDKLIKAMDQMDNNKKNKKNKK